MSDIKCINGKYYDFGCKNESFLLTAKELKSLNVKNYYFMLRINDPRVADIDPFKKNITKQEVMLLMQEFKSNMWSFIRMAVRLRTDAGIVPYGLHRGLAAALWCFERHQDSCLCEPRQTWKTTGLVAGPIQWSFQLSANLHMHFYGKENENTKANLNHLKTDIELLPEWLQFRRYMDDFGKEKKSRQSTEILENGAMHNKLTIHSKPTSLSHAQSLGRGGSGAVIYYDEIEFTPFFPEILSNSAPLFKTASENAAAIGGPYCRLFSTTPGNLDTKEGRDAYPVIQSMIPWTEKIYDMTDAEIAEYKSAFKEEYNNSDEVHTREVVDVFYIEYQYFQLRKSYDWVLEQYKLSGDKLAIRREILLQRLRGSTASPIEPEDIEYLISNMVKSTREILLCGKWIFKIYEHGAGQILGMSKDLDENIPYLVGIDPAGGGGGDNFAITIVNPYNLKIAAEFKSPYISGPAAIRMLQDLVHLYIPKAVLCLERNSMGITILQMLLETDIRDNLYYTKNDRVIDEITEEDATDRQLMELSQQYKRYGTYLSGKVRKMMFELLFQHIAECKEILCTEYLVNDLCQLVRTSTGRIEADKGQHDDCLFSYLHAIFIYYTGDNLISYGITRSKNPIWDQVDTVKDDSSAVANAVSAVIDPQMISYDEQIKADYERQEDINRTLAETFSFINDPLHVQNNDPLASDTVNIGSWFFDSINS